MTKLFHVQFEEKGLVTFLATVTPKSLKNLQFCMLCFTFEVFLKITSKTCVALPYGEVGGANGGEGGALQVLGPYGEDPDCRYHKP